MASRAEPGGSPLIEPLNLEEFEGLARERLDATVYDYYAGGSEDELSLRENRRAFERRLLRPRVLVDVAELDLSTELLAMSLPFPILLAPTALQGLAHPEGEVATARAAAASGALLVLSTVSSCSLEEVARASPAAKRWFQLYCARDRAVSEGLVGRAADAGYGALVVTVDVPYLGRRERDIRNALESARPLGVNFGNFPTPPPAPDAERSTLERWRGWIQTPSLTWNDLAWLKSLSPLPLVVKGILRSDDAKRAVDAGAEAIWLSNHGGRQLDGAVSALDALPEVAAAVGTAFPLIVDGGVRRGTDVLKALALGARAVAIGRPQLWGLAIDGEAGVGRVLETLRDELSLAMALAGCRSPAEIGPDLLA